MIKILKMKALTCFVFYFLGLASVDAQVAYKEAVKFADDIKTENLKKNLSIIAGAEMEGRETGTPGQARAAGFIADYYKQIGLQPGNNGSYFQYYPLIKDSVAESTLQINGKAFKYGEDYTLPASINSNGTIQSDLEVVWGGYGISDSAYNDLKDVVAKGKALLVLTGEPQMEDKTYLFTHTKRPSRWSSLSAGVKLKAQAAAKLEAKVLFIIDTNFIWKNKFISPIRLVPDAKDSISMNVYIISKEMAKVIAGSNYDRLVGSAGKIHPAGFHALISLFTSQQVSHKNIQASNVMAYLPGTDRKDELLIISAHYDHLGVRNGKIFYGADDNGSGTVAVLEMAREFAAAKAAGHGPRRSVLFMNVSGEEEGLWGSDYYTTHPVYPLVNTIADLNTDMIGRIDPLHENDPNYLYIIGDDKLSSVLRLVNEGNNKAYVNLNLDYKYNDPNDAEKIYYRSDHYNFAKNRIPIIFFFDGIHADYHQPSDTADKINYELMAKRMKLVFYDAWSIANRYERLPVDRNEK